MTLRYLLPTLLLLSLSQQVTAQPTGDAEHGRALWLETLHVECRDCHGDDGEGAFGPDLAGRALTRAQFIHAVRKPWGIMPAYAESQISDQELTDVMAYLGTLPGVDEPGPWRRQVPVGASPGLTAATTTGCTQCHHPLFNNGRAMMGAIDADFAWFRSIVYAHTAAYPATRARVGDPPFERLAMGSFSPSRVPDSVLQSIWAYILDLGFRPRVRGQLSAGVPSSEGVVYTLNVDNSGVEGIGIAAEDVTLSLVVPDGASVVSATGAGYRGVGRDADNDADVAVWEIASIGAQDRQTFTLTLSQAGTAGNDVHGRLAWATPSVTTPFVNIAAPRPGAEAH
jgi:cytochrome c553